MLKATQPKNDMAVQLKRSKASEVISMTPLIDVVFLLLIFFLVASQFADEEENREGSPVENEIEVSLPSASDAVPLTAETNSMFVTVTKEGRFFLDGNSLTADQLETALQTAKQYNPSRLFFPRKSAQLPTSMFAKHGSH